MMTKEEISKAIVECEERLTKLREELTNPERSGKRWKPKFGERFFYISSCGDVFDGVWSCSKIAEGMYDLANIFPSQEAAEFEVERRKVIAELSDFAEGDDAVWDKVQPHYLLYYDYTTDRVEWGSNLSAKQGQLYFPSVKAAKAAVEAVGAERVKKYYLGVCE